MVYNSEEKKNGNGFSTNFFMFWKIAHVSKYKINSMCQEF